MSRRGAGQRKQVRSTSYSGINRLEVLEGRLLLDAGLANVVAPANGTYRAGEVLPIWVTFNDQVTVDTLSGTPSISLNNGGTASYVGSNSELQLVFDYTVAPGQDIAELDFASAAALQLNGGTIHDSGGVDAILTLPAPGEAGSLGAISDIAIDTIPPKVNSIASATSDGAYKADSTIQIIVSFDDRVDLDTLGGTPSLLLNDGAEATYFSGSGTGSLVFRYVVGSGQNVADLDYASTSALELNGGTIRDEVGNDADLTLATPGAADSLGANADIVIDTTPPTVTINQDVDQTDPARSTPTNFTVVFSEPVSGFSSADVTLAGTAGATTAVVTGSGTTYNVAVSGMTNSGTVIVSLPADSAEDVAENASQASTSTDNSLVYEVAVPILSGGTQFVDTNGDQVTVTLKGDGSGNLYFAHDNPCDIDAIVLSGTTAGSSLTISVQGAGRTTRITDIEVAGSLARISAADADLLGDISISGSLGSLDMRDVVGSQSAITIGDGSARLDARFGQIMDLSIDSGEAISSLRATNWSQLDTDNADAITAPSLGSLVVDGDFDATLILDGQGSQRRTLGQVRIGGNVASQDWQVDGSVGKVSILGAVDAFTLAGVTRDGLDDIAGLRLGNVMSADILATGAIGPVFASQWLAGSIAGASISSLKIAGSRGVAGDFAADVDLSGAGSRRSTLGSARIDGQLGGVWTIGGDAGSVSADSAAWTATFTGDVNQLRFAHDFAGALSAGSVRTMTVGGKLSNTHLTLTQAVDPAHAKRLTLGKLSVKGWMDTVEVRSAGSIGTVTAGGLTDSLVFAGVKDSVTALPTRRADFVEDNDLLASIASVRVTGVKGEDADSLWVSNSAIAAWSLGRVSLRNIDPDNQGDAFGLACDRLSSYECTRRPSARSPGSARPAPARSTAKETSPSSRSSGRVNA